MSFDLVVVGVGHVALPLEAAGMAVAGYDIDPARPDLGAVRAAARAVSDHLRPGTLAVLESTSFPGTTDEVVRPILERHGLVAGDDFRLGYSPERIDLGNCGFGNTPKVAGGHTALCAKHCAAFYGRFVESVVVARGTREACWGDRYTYSYRVIKDGVEVEVGRGNFRFDFLSSAQPSSTSSSPGPT
ncbi:hypothetical protein [Saccharothrix stipae]